MIIPEKVNGVNPHYIEQQALVYSKGNTVFKAGLKELAGAVKEGRFSAGTIKNAAAKIDIAKRIGRLGFHKIKPFKQGLIGIQHGSIVYKAEKSKEFKVVFSGFRGSRPLDLFIHPETNETYFGEYFSNNEREEVHIFSSSDLNDWKKAWTFKSGEIRHVHGLVWDSYRKGIWVLTGDTDEESGLWFTNDNFRTLVKIVGGSQKARAVEVIPVEDGLIVPMDSPSEQNFIFEYNFINKSFTNLAKIPGSAFHACISNGIYLVSTVTEPSEVNKVDYASVWASSDGKSWKEISRLEKDIFPVKYQGITRYSEIYFTSGNNESEYIIGYGQAIKGMSNCMLLWKKSEILNILSGNDIK